MKVKVKIRSRKNIQKDQPKLWRIARYLGIATGVAYWFSCCWMKWMTGDLTSILFIVGIGTGGYILALSCFKAGYIIEYKEAEMDAPEKSE